MHHFTARIEQHGAVLVVRVDEGVAFGVEGGVVGNGAHGVLGQQGAAGQQRGEQGEELEAHGDGEFGCKIVSGR